MSVDDISQLLRAEHRWSLLDVVGLEQRLEDLPGADVDLVQEGTLKGLMRQRIEQEAVRDF